MTTLSVRMSTSSSHLISLMGKIIEQTVIPRSLISAYCTVYRALRKRKIDPRDTRVKKHTVTTKESFSEIPYRKGSSHGASEITHRNQPENRTLLELTFILVFSISLYVSVKGASKKPPPP